MKEQILEKFSINKLSQSQFDRASQNGDLDEYAIYLTLDEGNNIITLFGTITNDLVVNIENTNYYKMTHILEDKNIPRLMLMKEDSKVIELKLYGYEDNTITFTSTLPEGILLVSIDHEDNITTSIEPFFVVHAEEDCVDISSENSNLLITEGAVWKSLNNFNALYTIYCNIIEQDGAYTSITLNGNKSLETILSEAVNAYQTSRGIVLADPDKEIYLQGLVAVESTSDNSYKFIFDVSQNAIAVKNIIHLDSTGFTCYTMNIQPKLTIEPSLEKDNNNPVSSGAVFSALADTKEEVLRVANGKSQTETFNNKAELENWIKNSTAETLGKFKLGDVFLLRSVGEPDYWWEPEKDGIALTAYAQDDIVVAGKGAARILETTKVDIQRIESTYAHKTIDLDGIKFKKAYKYSSSTTRQNGEIEYDTTNKKICVWANGSRGSWQDPDANTLYLIIEE